MPPRSGSFDLRVSLEDDQAEMFWPYRPRSGYPPAPAWLTVLVLFGGVIVFFLVLWLLAEAVFYGSGY